LRRAIFQIHLWVGIFLALYAVAIGVTGSLLVFADGIEYRLEPHLHHVAVGTKKASLQKALDNIKASHPTERVFSFMQAEDPESSASFALLPKEGKLDRSRVNSVYFNPYTGEILGERTTIQGPLGWARNLHYFLFGAETGLIVNGAMGIALLVMCLSGIVIWWPGILRWKRALGVSHRSNWKRFNWDLHSSVGFWSCAALLLVTFTGIYFAFPKAVTMLTVAGTGSNMKQIQSAMKPSVALQRHPGTPSLSLDAITAIAEKSFPEQKTVSYVLLPATPQSVFTAVQYVAGAAPFSRTITLDIDPSSGQILKQLDTAQLPFGMRVVQYYNALHFGQFGGNGAFGLVVKTLWVLLGLTPAVLGITGLLMYWNRSLKRLFS
jgi:uncharacterized iron-regulated membrane protein